MSNSTRIERGHVHQTPTDRMILYPDPVIWPGRGHAILRPQAPLRIIPPPIYNIPLLSELYRPPCPQYAAMPPGGIIRSGSSIVGTCSPNVGRDPFVPPWDFQCNNGVCVGANGAVGNSPNAVCCPPPSPVFYYPQPWQIPIYPVPYPFPPTPGNSCCDRQDVNSCAICLDNKQGLATSDAAGHFANMSRCRNTCGRY